MPDDYLALWRLIERATIHFCWARLGVNTPAARAGLYRRSAAMYAAVAESLNDLADAELGVTPAADMVKRSYGI